MTRWNLTDEVRDKIKPVLKEYLNKLENMTSEQIEKTKNEELGLDLSDKDINPSQLVDLLGEFGYEEYDASNNGWQMDFWIYMRRTDGRRFESTCEDLVISGCGMTFELKLNMTYLN